MFIAMNRFKVVKRCEAAFEQVWLSRDTHLDKVQGFVEFHLLKGPEADHHTLLSPSDRVSETRKRAPFRDQDLAKIQEAYRLAGMPE